MRFYADTSFLGNLFFDDQRSTDNARRIRDRFRLRPLISPRAFATACGLKVLPERLPG